MPGIIHQIMHDVPIGARIVVAGLCMQPDTIVPYYGIAKELLVQFVVAYSLEEFASALAAIADGRVDCSPNDHRHGGPDGLPGAFDALADPAQHSENPGRTRQAVTAPSVTRYQNMTRSE